MTTHTKQRTKFQPVSNLPLFAWRVNVLRPVTPAGQYVFHRYKVRPAVADLIAALAGIGSGVRQ